MAKKPKVVRCLTALTMTFSLLLVSACSSGGGEKPAESNGKNGFTITYLTSQSRMRDGTKQMAEALKKDENITVNFEIVPDNQLQTLMLTKIASGELPDVIDLNAPEMYPVYNALENFEDLSNEPWISRLENPDLYKYTDGKYYALPTGAPGLIAGAVYNKKVFSDLGLSVPNTYDEYLTLLETIKNKGVTPIFMSNKDTWTTQIPMLIYFGQGLDTKAVETYDSLIENKQKFADIPEFKQALVDFQDLIKNGYVNKDHVTATYEMSQQALVDGTAAIVISGNFLISDILNKWPDTDIGFFAIPYHDSDKVVSASIFTGLAALKNGSQVENTKKFLDLWSQPKYQDIAFKISPGLPTMGDINGGELPPAVKETYDKYFKTGKVVYQLNDFFSSAGGFLDSKLWPIYVEVAMGRSVDTAIADIDKELQQFGKLKKLPGFE